MQRTDVSGGWCHATPTGPRRKRPAPPRQPVLPCIPAPRACDSRPRPRDTGAKAARCPRPSVSFRIARAAWRVRRQGTALAPTSRHPVSGCFWAPRPRALRVSSRLRALILSKEFLECLGGTQQLRVHRRVGQVGSPQVRLG